MQRQNNDNNILKSIFTGAMIVIIFALFYIVIKFLNTTTPSI